MTTFFSPSAHGFLLFALGVSTVVFLTAWASTWFLPSPDARHRAWVLSFAVTGLWLGLGLLRWEVTVPILPTSKAGIETKKSHAQVQSPLALPDQPALTTVSSAPARQPSAEPPREPVPGTAAATPRHWNVVPVIWASGTFLALLPLIFGEYQCRRLRRTYQPVEDERILKIYDAACETIALRARPRLCLSPDITSPILGSPFQPELVLPLEATSWTDRECECTLHHELAHFQRRDLPTFLFVTALTAVLWFQPLAWMGRRRVRQEAEMAADDLVITSQDCPVA